MTDDALLRLKEAAERYGLQPPCQICKKPITKDMRQAPSTAVVLVCKECMDKRA